MDEILTFNKLFVLEVTIHRIYYFRDRKSTLAIKRLWFHLIRQECLKEIFLRYVFGRKKIQAQQSRVNIFDHICKLL